MEKNLSDLIIQMIHLILDQYFFCIRPPPGLLPVLGPLTRNMTPTLDAALLMCGSPEWGKATSSRAGADLLVIKITAHFM